MRVPDNQISFSLCESEKRYVVIIQKGDQIE